MPGGAEPKAKKRRKGGDRRDKEKPLLSVQVLSSDSCGCLSQFLTVWTFNSVAVNRMGIPVNSIFWSIYRVFHTITRLILVLHQWMPLNSVVDPDPHQLKSRIRIRIRVKVISQIRIRIKVMRICNTISQYINFSNKIIEKSIKLAFGPDPDPHKKQDPPVPLQVKSRIRIRIYREQKSGSASKW